MGAEAIGLGSVEVTGTDQPATRKVSRRGAEAPVSAFVTVSVA